MRSESCEGRVIRDTALNVIITQNPDQASTIVTSSSPESTLRAITIATSSLPETTLQANPIVTSSLPENTLRGAHFNQVEIFSGFWLYTLYFLCIFPL